MFRYAVELGVEELRLEDGGGSSRLENDFFSAKLILKKFTTFF